MIIHYISNIKTFSFQEKVRETIKKEKGPNDLEKGHKEVTERDKSVETFHKMAKEFEESVETAKEQENLHKINRRPQKLYSDIVKGHEKVAIQVKEETKRSILEENASERIKIQTFQNSTYFRSKGG